MHAYIQAELIQTPYSCTYSHKLTHAHTRIRHGGQVGKSVVTLQCYRVVLSQPGFDFRFWDIEVNYLIAFCAHFQTIVI